MAGKPDHWEWAQENERVHWERLIAGLMEGPPDYGGEKFWVDLWYEQGKFLRSILGSYIGRNSRSLEIGGGVIGVIRWLEGVKVAIDPLGDLFSEAYPKLPLGEYGLSRHEGIIHIVGAAEDMEWASMRPFKFVLMFDTLDHCRDPGKVLEGIQGVLRPDGWFLEATTAFHVKFETSEEYQRHHPWAWTKEELLGLIQGAGFDMITATDDLWPVHPGFKEQGANSDQILHVWRKSGAKERL